MIKLEVDKSGKAIIYRDEIHFLPLALIQFFIMSAGKVVEVRVEPGGPFVCISDKIKDRHGKEVTTFKLNNNQFRVCSDIAYKAFNGSLEYYESGKSYYLSVKESRETKKPVKTKKTKGKKGSK